MALELQELFDPEGAQLSDETILVDLPLQKPAAAMAIELLQRDEKGRFLPKADTDIEEYFGTEPPAPGWTSAGSMRWVKERAAPNSRPPSKTAGPRIAIVGGGPAGLFTAHLLNQKFPQAELTVFEASSALGGKICTDRFEDGTPFEAGVAELYEYLGPGGDDPLRQLIEKGLGLATVNMKGGTVILGEQILRDADEVADVFAPRTAQLIKSFHKRMAELMPLEKFAKRWQPDNDHPWANKTFYECIREEIPDDPIAISYIETAVHSDLATEPHTCNGLNGIKNVLLDNDEYMQLYHVRGGLGKIVDRLLEEIRADFRLESPVVRLDSGSHSYTVHFREEGEAQTEDFEAVIVALPNHWLTQIKFTAPSLDKAIHEVIAHYDLPAHYYRITLLFDEPFWEELKIPGDFWMMDMFNGCCCYNESFRWGSSKGHVLSFLLAGQDALLQDSADLDDERVVENLIDSLPDCFRAAAREHLLDAQINSFVGSINAQPGGWPVPDLYLEHCPDKTGSPGVFLTGDYFFDSTLNACLISAGVAVDHLLGFFKETGASASKIVEDLLDGIKEL